MGKLLRVSKLLALIGFAGLATLMLAFSLPFTGWKALSVQTGSMVPAIDPGALVLVHRVPTAELQVGDVITYMSRELNNQLITHRITEIKGKANGPKQIIVKGDANPVADAPVSEFHVVGKVAKSVPHLGAALDFVKTPLGLALFVYLPAALLFISEIRLLVRRLAKLEIDKQKAHASQQSVFMPPALATAPAMPVPGRSVAAPESDARQRRMVKIQAVLIAGLLASSVVMSTQAALTAGAKLTGNTIAVANPQQDAASKIRINRVDFPGASTDQTSFQPIIYLFNPTRGVTVDIEGWTLESSNGQVFGFNGPTPLFPRHRFFDVHAGPSGKLLIGGDYLVLKNKAGQVVDALSWGSDASQFSPSVQGIVAQKHVQRIDADIDTNTANDWEVKP